MSLKDIPPQLKTDSEEDLRALVLAYCSELGFDADEISCEDHFTIYLGHHSIKMNKTVVGGRSDVLVSRNGKPLAIIETKSPSHDLTDGDANQAISYARLLATIAPFAIVTNGRDTRVYDVLAENLTQVDNPQDSRWHKNGQQLSGIKEELRYEAAKLLIAITPDTVKQFCQQQIATALIDLKSDVNQNKKYIPDLYVERRTLNEAFTAWLRSERPVFALVAPSGYGKTNFMCAEAENTISSHFSLFYSAGGFKDGLVQAIRNDFIWEFHRDKELVQIFDRLDTIAKTAGKKFLIFVDAIDENPSGIRAIKNELLDMVRRIRAYPNIRLILSCKSFDWAHIVVDGGQFFNILAEAIQPTLSHPNQRSTTPDAQRIGFHLEEFTPEELNEAITKYKAAYLIDGDFHGEILEESRNPLMLRFIAEIYEGAKEKLPTSISSLDLFTLYFRRKLDLIDKPNFAEIILSKVAILIFASANMSVSKDEIVSDFSWSEGYDNALQDLFRLGVFSKSIVDGQEKIGFEFNKFLLYVYVFKVKKLDSLSPDRQILLFRELINTRIGTEALDFYLVAVSQKVAHAVLIELASQDLPLFAQISTGLKGIKSYKKLPYPIDNVHHYLEFYNFLRDTYFSELANSIMPYTKKPLGIIIYGGRYGSFRARTEDYPMPIVEVNDPNLIKQAFQHSLNQQFLDDLQPVGPFYMSGIEGLDDYPQSGAYIHLLKELSAALSHRMLNESKSQDILRERILDVLLYNPTMWLVEDPLPHERYWKLLGYSGIEELKVTIISDLVNRINDLLKSFDKRLQQRDALYPSYFSRSGELLSTLYALSQLDAKDSLGSLRYSRERLSRQGGQDIEIIKKEIENIIPIIVENYKLIFAENFPSLTKYSKFFTNIDKLAIVEIINLRSVSEFPTLSYIVFPHTDQPASPKIVDSRYGHSITGNLKYQSLHGEIEWGSVSGGFGHSKIDVTLDGERLHEPTAWVIKTRFSSNTPILDQVYSLISSDLRYLLNAININWRDYSYSPLANDQYIRRAASSIS